MVLALRASTRDTDLTIKSDHSYTVPRSRRLKPEQSEIAPSVQDIEEAHSSKDLGPPPPPLPPPLLAEEPHTPKGKDTHISSSMAVLMVQFQQHHNSRSPEVIPHSTPEKVATPRETPTKETPWKSEQTPSKKDLTPDTTSEPNRQEATDWLAQHRLGG